MTRPIIRDNTYKQQDRTDERVSVIERFPPAPSGSAAPVGPAGGVLAGDYPNPIFAVDMATQAELNAAIANLAVRGAISVADLDFDPATQAELDAAVANLAVRGAIGVADLNFDVATQAELAAAIVNLAVRGTIAVADLSFDPATQAELNAAIANVIAIGSAAGGDLTGTFPNPTIATGVVTDVKVAAANKDGAASTPSMRTLGTGAAQAAAGNDARLSDQRVPVDGSVSLAKLSATGTKDATTFLRGDNTFAVPAGGGGGSGVQKVTAFPAGATDGDLVVRIDMVGDPLFKFTDGAWEQQPRMGAQTVPAVTAGKTALQTIPNATQQPIQWESESVDTDAMHGTVRTNLTGTVAKTAGQNTLAGTGTAFTTELAVGDAIFVPDAGGGAFGGDYAVVTAITSNTALTVKDNWVTTASGQTARKANEAFVFKTPGRYFLDASLNFASNTVGRRAIHFYKGSAQTLVARNEFNPTVATGLGTEAPLTAMATFAAYDFIVVAPYQTSGGNLDVAVGARFEAIWISGPGQTVDERGVPAARLRHSSLQSIPSAVDTALTWDTEDFDTDGMHDPAVNATRMVIKTPGLYDLNAQVVFTGANGGLSREVRIVKNGTLNLARIRQIANASFGGAAPAIVANTKALLAPGDYLEIIVQQDSGSANNIQVLGSESPVFSAMLVGSAKTVTPYARVYNNANTAIPGGTNTALAFNSERSDNDNIHDTAANTTRMVCKTAGIYAISAHISLIAPLTTGRFAIWLRKTLASGGNIITAIGNIPANAYEGSVTTVDEMAVGDYYEVLVFSAGAVTVASDATNQYVQDVSMVKIGSPSGGNLPGIVAAGVPAVRAVGLSALQTVPNNTDTAIAFGSAEEYDTDSIHDLVTNTTRFTAKTAGLYSINASLAWNADASNTGGIRYLRLKKNGSLFAENDRLPNSDTIHTWFQQVTATVMLAAGDYVELIATQDSGGSKVVGQGVGDARNYFSMQLVGSGKTVLPYARVYKTAAQSIPGDGTDTLVSFDSEDSDTDSIHDTATNTTRLTCRTDGVYLVKGSLAFASNTSGSRWLALLKNGGYVEQNIVSPTGDARATAIEITSLISLVVGDYIELMATQTSGGALALSTGVGDRGTKLSMVKVGSTSAASTGVDVVEGMHLVGGTGEPAFQNAFANAGSPHASASFYKDRNRVYLRGLLNTPAAVTNKVIFTLPTGYRPSVIEVLPTISGNAMAKVQVNTDGTVQVTLGASSDQISLAGLSFRADGG